MYLQCYFVGLLHSSGVAGGSQLIPADVICRDERCFLGTLAIPGQLSERGGQKLQGPGLLLPWCGAQGDTLLMVLLPFTSPPLPTDQIAHWGWLWSGGWYGLAFTLVTAVGRPDNWGLGCGMGAEIVGTLLLLADQTMHQGPGCVGGPGMPRDFAASAGAVGRSDCLPGSR